MNRFWMLPLLTLLTASAIDRYQSAELTEVRFTEILYNAPGLDEDNEWFELANVGDRPVDLSGFVVTDEVEQGQGEGAVFFPDGTIMDPHQAITVAQNANAFLERYGRFPQFEIENSSEQVADMGSELRWANGRLALANAGDELILLTPDLRIAIDAIVYGSTGGEILAAFQLPAIPNVQIGQSIERIFPNCDTDSASDWQPNLHPTPGEIPDYGNCPETSPLADNEWVNIGAIQGRERRSPYLNTIVAFQGIVTGKMSDTNSSGTVFHSFFVQDETTQADGDPQTSDGIAVFTGIEAPEVEIGDLVAVKGQVIEFYDLTEIGHNELEVAVIAHNQALPSTLNLGDAYAVNQQDFEPYESMLVGIEQAVAVGPTYGGCEFAVVPVGNWIGPVIRQSLDDEIQLTLGVRNKSDTTCQSFPSLNVGDVVSGVSGPLTFTFGQYRILQQDPRQLIIEQKRAIKISAANAMDDERNLRVATFNLGDYFDAEQANSGPEEPILSSYELDVKSDKLAYSIGSTLACPDLLGIQEVENRNLLSDLVERLKIHCNLTYGIIHQDGPDARGIDVALLVNLHKLSIVDFKVHQTCSPIATTVRDSSINCASGENPLFSRPPLEVEVQSMGKPLLIYVNHFKSKREGELETISRRLAEAGFLRELVEAHVRERPAVEIIVLGDFNDFLNSETARTLLDGNVLRFAFNQIPPSELYSYNFSGISQLVDWILVSPSLVTSIVNAEIVHINADYSEAYSLRREQPYLGIRSSDHDIPLVDINYDYSEPETIPSINAIQTISQTVDKGPQTFESPGPEASVGDSPVASSDPALLIFGSVFLIAVIGGIIRIVRRGF